MWWVLTVCFSIRCWTGPAADREWTAAIRPPPELSAGLVGSRRASFGPRRTVRLLPAAQHERGPSLSSCPGAAEGCGEAEAGGLARAPSSCTGQSVCWLVDSPRFKYKDCNWKQGLQRAEIYCSGKKVVVLLIFFDGHSPQFLCNNIGWPGFFSSVSSHTEHPITWVANFLFSKCASHPKKKMLWSDRILDLTLMYNLQTEVATCPGRTLSAPNVSTPLTPCRDSVIENGWIYSQTWCNTSLYLIFMLIANCTPDFNSSTPINTVQ